MIEKKKRKNENEIQVRFDGDAITTRHCERQWLVIGRIQRWERSNPVDKDVAGLLHYL